MNISSFEFTALCCLVVSFLYLMVYFVEKLQIFNYWKNRHKTKQLIKHIKDDDIQISKIVIKLLAHHFKEQKLNNVKIKTTTNKLPNNSTKDIYVELCPGSLVKCSHLKHVSAIKIAIAKRRLRRAIDTKITIQFKTNDYIVGDEYVFDTYENPNSTVVTDLENELERLIQTLIKRRLTERVGDCHQIRKCVDCSDEPRKYPTTFVIEEVIPFEISHDE